MPLLALPVPPWIEGPPAVTARPASFTGVIGLMWPPDLGLVLASGGFDTIAAFLALRYAAVG